MIARERAFVNGKITLVSKHLSRLLLTTSGQLNACRKYSKIR